MEKKNIVVSCDTTIALSADEIKQKNLHVIPLNVIVDEKEYHDTVDIDREQLATMMKNGSKISTSTPTIGEITSYFDKLFEETKADVVLHFTISSKLSSMFSLFSTVCQEKYGDKVIIIDSLSICYWMVNQVYYAIEMVKHGYDVKDILANIEALKNTEDCVFIPESLVYLKRGGRISPALASIANFIGVLPIMSFNNGEVDKKSVTRTMYKALTKALKEWHENLQDFENNYDLVIITSDDGNQSKIKQIEEIIQENTTNMQYDVRYLSLNVIAHAGPGTVGIGIIKKWKL